MKSPRQYYSEARERAGRRRSPWNVTLLLVKWPLAGIWWVALYKLVLWIPHRGTLTFHEVAQHDIPMMFISLPLLFLSFILAMITANYLFYLIPHARRTFKEEAGNNSKLKFRNTQKVLLKIALIMALVILPIALIASWKIKPQQVQSTITQKADFLQNNQPILTEEK
jgi:hypothetical protein